MLSFESDCSYRSETLRKVKVRTKIRSNHVVSFSQPIDVVIVVVFEVEFGKYGPLFSFSHDSSFGLVVNSLSCVSFFYVVDDL